MCINVNIGMITAYVGNMHQILNNWWKTHLIDRWVSNNDT